MADPVQVERHVAFRDALIAHGHMIPSGVAGIWGRGAELYELLQRVHVALDPICRDPGVISANFPPVTTREVMRKTGYMASLPHLAGSVHAFTGSDKALPALTKVAAEGGDWSPHLTQTDVVLTPAACYPVYPTQTGTLPPGGRIFDVTGYCFRHEPSPDPMRLQSFQMRENIRIGSPKDAQDWRGTQRDRGLEFLQALGLPVRLALANDPFFGRGGKMLASNQLAMELKFEILVSAYAEDQETALASFNYHEDHFSDPFGIKTADGQKAHTACLGYGLDRIALSLLKVHGLSPALWPASVRAILFK